MTATDPDAGTPYIVRIDFVLELARRLHIYGTSAQRLEGAVSKVAKHLGMEAEIWSNPTGMLVSFADVERGPPYTITRVIRLEPGETHLGRLAVADAIAEDVLLGRRDIAEGLQAMRALDRPSHHHAKFWAIFSSGLASASVVGLMQHTGWADLSAAAVIGAMIGALCVYSQSRPRWADACEALAALLATIAASAVATFIAPLSLQGVIIASLIVLMPGLMLTNAVSELTSNQLVSGTARFAGALTVLLKLTFGAVAGANLVDMFGWPLLSNSTASALPEWVMWVMLLVGSFAFAVLFKAARRDTLLVMASVCLGFFAVKFAAFLPGADFTTLPTGVFFAGMVVAAVSNAYGRYFHRPGALVRVPGIILLVPGSLGFRSFNFVFERNMTLGLEAAIAVTAALTALVAGLLFGNLLVSPRRNL